MLRMRAIALCALNVLLSESWRSTYFNPQTANHDFTLHVSRYYILRFQSALLAD